MKKFFLLLFVAVFLLASNIQAKVKQTDAMNYLKLNLDQAILILKDPVYKEPSQKKIQRDKIWHIVLKTFDFTEISKRSLARNWRKFNKEEKIKFIKLFANLLGHVYIDKLVEGYNGEDINYLNETALGDNVVVKTTILKDNAVVPIDYKMRMKKGTWFVYDVLVEGVSLIKNYRSQFNKILVNKKPQDLIDDLENKNKE